MRTITVGALLAFTLTLGGCGKAGENTSARIGSTELKQVKVSRREVRLPPPPSFKKDHAPSLYPDQTLSVYGLRKDIKAFKNKTVRVKAFLLEVYQCPKCPKGAQCKPCDAPHFWISDRKNGKRDKALLVTDYPEKHPKTRQKLSFEPGVRYVVTGLFTKRSGTGFSNADGLLVFRDFAKVVSE